MKKLHIRKSDWIAILITLIFFQLMSLWCIDVSTTTLLFTQQTDTTTMTMTNGFFTQNPLLTYHLGLYGIVITTFLLALITTHLLLKTKDTPLKTQ